MKLIPVALCLEFQDYTCIFTSLYFNLLNFQLLTRNLVFEIEEVSKLVQ